MNTAILIPCRLASTRLPGKVIAFIEGKSLVSRVYEEALKTKFPVIVVGGDLKILEVMEKETSIIKEDFIHTPHITNNGTERCLIAVIEKNLKYDNYIIWQADEIIRYSHILSFYDYCIDTHVSVGNIVMSALRHERDNVNQVKASMKKDQILYLHRNIGTNDPSQIGVYFYTKEMLEVFGLRLSILEQVARAELNRMIERGKEVYGFYIPADCDRAKVDTPQDLNLLRRIIKSWPNFPER